MAKYLISLTMLLLFCYSVAASATDIGDIVAKAKLILAARKESQDYPGRLEADEEFEMAVVDPLVERYDSEDPPDEVAAAVKTGRRIISGAVLLSEQITLYLAESKGHVREQTREDNRGLLIGVGHSPSSI
jgi:hypothetical protein